MSNRVKVFAYRLSHAALPCSAMFQARRASDRDRSSGEARRRAVCPACPHTPGRARALETYSHLFLDCPTYRPAVEWLLDLWEAVSGHRPPAEAMVVITADPAAGWEAAPTGQAALVWTALRCTVLYHVWAARCSPLSADKSAAAVVLASIASVSSEIRLHFNRACLARDTRDIPKALLRVAAPLSGSGGGDEDDGAFDVWVSSRLARVEAPATPGGRRRLYILLSAVHPVPAPTPAAAG